MTTYQFIASVDNSKTIAADMDACMCKVHMFWLI